MKRFVIRRISDGKYVALPGSKNSYTQFLQKAQTFNTKKQAENNMCIESEYVENLY